MRGTRFRGNVRGGEERGRATTRVAPTGGERSGGWKGKGGSRTVPMEDERMNYDAACKCRIRNQQVVGGRLGSDHKGRPYGGGFGRNRLRCGGIGEGRGM